MPVLKRRVDGLDEPIRVLSSQLWLGFCALALAALGAGIWGEFGNIPQHVNATGVLSGSAGFRMAEAPAAGSITQVLVGRASHVTMGEVIATETTGKVSVKVTAPVTGTLVRCFATPGEAVNPGAPVASISPSGPVQLATLFVPAAEATSLANGQSVSVGGGAILLAGKIASVNWEPLSTTDITNQFGTTDAPGLPSGTTPEVEVTVMLTQSPALSDLPPFAEVVGSIVVGTERPYKALF